MNTTNNSTAATRRWTFAVVLVVALVATALISTAVTNALTGGQVIEQLRSYYVYLPVVFNR